MKASRVMASVLLLIAWNVRAAAPATEPSSQPVARTDVSLLARALATSTSVHTIRSITTLYGLQHKDRYPSLEQLQNWKVFLRTTDADGNFIRRNTPDGYGPYLSRPPINGLTGLGGVCSASDISPDAGWAVEWRQGRPMLLAVVPDIAHPLIQRLVSFHVAIATDQVSLAREEDSRAVLLSYTLLRAQADELAAEFEGSLLGNAMAAYGLDHPDEPFSYAKFAGGKLLLEARPAYMPEMPVNPLMGGATEVARHGHALATTGWTVDEETGTVRLVVPRDYRSPLRLSEERVDRPKP